MENNVEVSGIIVKDVESTNTTLLKVLVDSIDSTIDVSISSCTWENFKKAFPKNYKAVDICGVLAPSWGEKGDSMYAVNATSVTCFHNLLKPGGFNGSLIKFRGKATLQKKFEFSTNSNLYLKKVALTTVPGNVSLEVEAIRDASNYFNEIKEGDVLIVEAVFAQGAKDSYPCWRVKKRPVLFAH